MAAGRSFAAAVGSDRDWLDFFLGGVGCCFEGFERGLVGYGITWKE